MRQSAVASYKKILDNRLFSSWRRSGFLRSVALVASGTIVGQALLILTSPLLTRLYGPGDFGVLTVYSALLYTLVALGSLRYEMAIPLPDKDAEAVNLLVLSFGVLFLISAATGGVVWVMGDQIAQAFAAPDIRHYLWLLPIGLFGAGMYQILSNWAIRKKTFGLLAQTTLLQSLTQTILQIGLGILRIGPLGLLLGHLGGQAGGSGTLIRSILATQKETFRTVSRAEVESAARRYRRFPLILSWAALLNTLSLQLPALLLAAFYGLPVAGWFALTERVSRAPLRLVGVAVAQVYFGEASQTAKANRKGLARLFDGIAWKLAVFGGLPLLLAGFVGPWVFSVVFGDNWHEAGRIFQLMIFSVAAQFVVSPLSQTAIVLERQDLQLWGDAIRTILVLAAFVAAYALGWSYLVAIGTYSILMACSYIGFFFIYRSLVMHG